MPAYMGHQINHAVTGLLASGDPCLLGHISLCEMRQENQEVSGNGAQAGSPLGRGAQGLEAAWGDWHQRFLDRGLRHPTTVTGQVTQAWRTRRH